MSPSSENRYAPPSSAIEDMTGESPGLVMASRWMRFGGSIIDGLAAVLFAGLVALFAGRSLLHPASGENPLRYLALNWAIGLGSFLVLNAYLLVAQGQTVAKALLGMRIVRPNGDRVSPGRLFGLRYAPTWILTAIPLIGSVYALIDSLLIYRPSRRCLHDSIADTIVIRS